MERILAVGVTGAGKSTLAQTLSGRLGLPYHEMAEPLRIIDSLGYPEVRDLLWNRADTVIWLDYPKRVIMPRVLRRSFRRSLRREVLFGGNRETWTGWMSREHPAWWAWSQHGTRRREVEHRVRDPRFAPLDTRRFGHPHDTATWLASL
ncbi:adenylate kinase [Streptomyces sp. NBC_00457]